MFNAVNYEDRDYELRYFNIIYIIIIFFCFLSFIFFLFSHIIKILHCNTVTIVLACVPCISFIYFKMISCCCCCCFFLFFSLVQRLCVLWNWMYLKYHSAFRHLKQNCVGFNGEELSSTYMYIILFISTEYA